jgi:23S rRNA (uracil1939-C5)-methyltransferase
VRRTQSKKSLALLEPSQSEWQIVKLVPGGAGFLRLSSGQGAFAPGALPGDRIQVLEAEDHRTYLKASRWTLLAASPDRVAPVCPVQSRCGGCDLMTLDYSAQLRAKAQILDDALRRTGQFETLPEISCVASDETLGYRSRIRVHVGSAGQLGFFAPQSRDLVEIPGCVVAQAELDTGLCVLRSIAHEHRAEISLFSDLELRAAPDGPPLSLRLVPLAGRLAGGKAIIAALSREFQVSIAERPADEAHDQRFPLPGGVTLRAPGAAFTQVNWAVNQRLVQALLDGARARACQSFCDLYCGAGNFSLPLLASGLGGVGIESSQVAIDAAKRAAAEQRFTRGRFVAGDVVSALFALPREERFDLIVLDPPRTGAREVLSEVMRRAPRQIAYCACDPVTLARDLRALCAGGYVLEHLTCFDMFPQTHHFETLAWLSLSAPALSPSPARLLAQP